MKPTTFQEGFAAGAAYGAAKDQGLDDMQSAQGAYLAGKVAEKKNADAKKEAEPETRDERPVKKDGFGLRKPCRQPGPGLLLRLAHWLNLK